MQNQFKVWAAVIGFENSPDTVLTQNCQTVPRKLKPAEDVVSRLIKLRFVWLVVAHNLWRELSPKKSNPLNLSDFVKWSFNCVLVKP